MDISVIASGSNGNCCLFEDKDTSVLIDAGKSAREIELRMQRLGKNLENVDAVVITHSHTDHVCGAGIIARKYDIPVFLSKQSYKESVLRIGDCEVKQFDGKFKIKNLEINPVPTSHSVHSNGFVINKFGLFTDTGIVTKEMEEVFPKLKAVLLESNHDIDMLINGHYPHYLKQWILSDEGHLNNIEAGTLVQDKGEGLSLVLLGHLSGNNNTPEVCRKTFETLVKRKIDYSVLSREKESGSWKI